MRLPDSTQLDDTEALPTRSPYAPANIFYLNHMAPIESLRHRLPPNLKRATIEKPMRLSPAMLEIMTAAHRTVGVQSSETEKAVAELFRRCSRLQEELGEQVKQMSELAQRLQNLQTGEDEQGEGKSQQARIKDARERQERMVSRYEALRRKVGRVGSKKRELSSKEVGWMGEIERLGRNVGVYSDDENNQTDQYPINDRLDTRFLEVRFEHSCEVSSLSANLNGQGQKSRPRTPRRKQACRKRAERATAATISRPGIFNVSLSFSHLRWS
jgi:nucleoporin NUP82